VVEYANGTQTEYSYDSLTFRVRNIETMRGSDVLQNLFYWYDPVGNITRQRDNAHQTLFYDNGIAEPENDYTYDALYRLIQATGREHEGNSAGPDVDSWTDGNRIQLAHTHDETKMRTYTQQYDYDAVGNMLEQRHICGGTYNWTKEFTIDSDSNRLASVATAITETYGYDNRGNLVGGMAHLADLIYNESNRLEVSPNVTGTIITYYQYDYAGQRVRKVTEDTNSGILHTRKYVGQWETYTKDQSGTILERETLHVGDDTGRIALIDTPVRDDFSTGEVQLLRYQYSNHLGTATLELDDSGNIISYEEYYPFGTTSFQSGRTTAEVSLKRYRFTGKERDEETGMYYHGARYYIPWLCRWSAVDPLQGEMSEWSSYNYGYCNPIRFTDSTGMQPDGKEEIKPIAPAPAKLLDVQIEPPKLQPVSIPEPQDNKMSEAQAAKFSFELFQMRMGLEKFQHDLEARPNIQLGLLTEVKQRDPFQASTTDSQAKSTSSPIGKGGSFMSSIEKMMGDTETRSALENASKKTGLDLESLMTMAIVESRGRKSIGTKKYGYTGLMQLGKAAMSDIQKSYPDLTYAAVKEDVTKNALAGAIYWNMNARQLAHYKIQSTVLNQYLAHQQGAKGLSNLLNTLKTAPNSPATPNQLSNLPPKFIKQNSGNVTQLDFYSYWRNQILTIQSDVHKFLKR